MRDPEETPTVVTPITRRDALSLVLHSGAVIALTRIADPDPAEAATPSVEFQRGKLSGGEFDGWEAVLAITGQAVRGTIYDPTATTGGTITGYRVRGTAKGKVLELDFFEIEDIGFDTSVGGGRGKEKKGGKTTTNFEIGGKGNGAKKGGQMTSKDVPISTRENRELAGTYRGVITDPDSGSVLREFNISATAAGKFSLTEPAGAPTTQGAGTAIAGRFGATRDGSIFITMLLPKLVPGELPFDPSEVNVLTPLADGQGRAGGPHVAELTSCGCTFESCGNFDAEPTGSITVLVKARQSSAANSPFVPYPGALVSRNGGAEQQVDANGFVVYSGLSYRTHNIRASGGPLFGRRLTPMSEDVDLQSDSKRVELILEFAAVVDIEGHVEDVSNGLGMPGALVELLSADTDQVVSSTSTNGDGAYSIDDVAEDDYRLRISKARFEPVIRFVAVRKPSPFRQSFSLRPLGVFLSDTDFPQNRWSLTKQFEDGSGARFQAIRQATGGNTGAFRRTEVEFPGGSEQLRLAHLYTGGSYDPAAEGPIFGIDYSFDTILLSGLVGLDHAVHALLIRQGPYWFVRDSSDETAPADTRWTTISGRALTADDFVNLSSGPEHPNFTAGGQVMQFGYLVQCSGTIEESGVDNWSVLVRT